MRQKCQFLLKQNKKKINFKKSEKVFFSKLQEKFKNVGVN